MPKQATRKKRNYRKEYDQYYGKKGSDLSTLTPEQRKHRLEKSARNKARSIMKAKQIVGKFEDVDHKDSNPLNNHTNNLQVVCRTINRDSTGERNGGTKKSTKRQV